MASENIKELDMYNEMQNMLKKTYLPDMIYVAQIINANWLANGDYVYLLFNSATKNKDTYLGYITQYIDLSYTYEYCICGSVNNDVNDIIMNIITKSYPHIFIDNNYLFANNNQINNIELKPTLAFLCNEFENTYSNVHSKHIPYFRKKIIDELLIMKTKLHNKYKQNILSCINLEEKALADIVIDYLI